MIRPNPVNPLKIFLTFVFLIVIVCLSSCGPRTQRKSIMWAAGTGDLQLLKDLEKEGQSINIQDPQAFKWSPLIAAIYHGNPDIVSYLVSRGAKLDLQDRQGETALMWAITTGDTNTVRLLLESGASVEITNTSGINAERYAEASEHREVLLDWLDRYKTSPR
jgi:ankyrin repeat protein